MGGDHVRFGLSGRDHVRFASKWVGLIYALRVSGRDHGRFASKWEGILNDKHALHG